MVEILQTHIAPHTRVLDISAYIPFSVAMERQMPAVWERTTYKAGIERFSECGKPVSIPAIALDCETEQWPLAENYYDLAIFSEVLEHLHRHPQTALAEVNRILKPGGLLLVSTPNITSWKKAGMLSDGDWDYDSPSFSNAWGHRYEYSFYQLHCGLKASGFEPLKQLSRDVYFDDPRGFAFWVEMGFLGLGKLLCGKWKKAAAFYLRRGSGLFFLYQKTGVPSTELITI